MTLRNIINFAASAGLSVWNFLCKDKMPIGITFLFAAATAVGTYYLAPEINSNIQRNNARSDHLVSSISRINDDIVELSKTIRRYNFSVSQRKIETSDQYYNDALDRVSSMQWRLLDLSATLESDEDSRDLSQFSKSLTILQTEIESSHSEKRQISSDVLKHVTESGFIILDTLYRKAGFNKVALHR